MQIQGINKPILCEKANKKFTAKTLQNDYYSNPSIQPVNLSTKIFLSQTIKTNKSSYVSFGNGYQPENSQEAELNSILPKCFMISDYGINQDRNTFTAALPEAENAGAFATELMKRDRSFISKHFFGDVSQNDKYGKLGYAIYLYKKDNDPYYKDLMNLLNDKNIRRAAKCYEGFYESKIKSLNEVENGNLVFTAFWANNGKIGNKKIADLWLELLGFEKSRIEEMKPEQKASELNKILKSEKQADKLAEQTIDYWLKNVLGAEIVKDEEELEIKNQDDKIEKINKIVEKLEQLQSQGKDEFAAFVNSSDDLLNFEIKGKPLIDLMVEAVQKEGDRFSSLPFDRKKHHLINLAKVAKCRNIMIDKAMADLIRENMRLDNDVQDNLSLKNSIEDIGKLKNELDTALVKKLFQSMPADKAKKTIQSLENYKAKSERTFNYSIPENPLLSQSYDYNQDNINYVFSLLDERIRTSSGKEPDSILKAMQNFIELSQKAKEQSLNKSEAEKSWKELTGFAEKQWQEKHLPKLLNQQLSDYIEFEKLTKSDEFAKIKSGTGKYISEILSSSDYTIGQKTFMLKKSISSESYDFRKFVLDRKPNSYLRTEFLENTMRAEFENKQSFKEFKNELIRAIREGDTNNPLLKMQIQKGNDGEKDNLAELLFAKTASKDEAISTRFPEKINHLSKLTDEELNLIADEYKEEYLYKLSLDKFNRESAKYDFGIQLEKNLDKLTVEINGAKVSIDEAMTTRFDELSKQFADSQEKQEELLRNIENLVCDNALAIDKQNVNLEKLQEKLDKMDVTLSVLEKRYPERKKDIDSNKSFLKNVRERIFKNPLYLYAIGRGTFALGTLAASGGMVWDVEGFMQLANAAYPAVFAIASAVIQTKAS